MNLVNRNATIMRMRIIGNSYKSIAALYHLSHSHVRTLCIRMEIRERREEKKFINMFRECNDINIYETIKKR